jgi:hypothetical protein
MEIKHDGKSPSALTSDLPSFTQEADKSQVSSGTDDADSLDRNIAKLIAAYVPALRTDPKCDTKEPKPEQSEEPSSGLKTGPRWKNMIAGPGFDQENRNVFVIDSKISQQLAEILEIHCIHDNPLKVGKGHQINGTRMVCDGDVKGADLGRNEWNNGIAWPSNSSGHGHQGVQINGIEVRIGGWTKDEGNKGEDHGKAVGFDEKDCI